MSINFHALEGLHYAYISRYVLSNLNKGTVKPITTFAEFKSDDFKLPVKVSGRLVTPGVYFEPAYGQIETSAEELKKVFHLWEGKDIFNYHDGFWQMVDSPSTVPSNVVVGRILKTLWNSGANAVDYFADIYDRDVAYKIYTRSIKHISVGFENDVNMDGTIPRKIDLEPREASLVYRPKDKQATVEINHMEFN